jgi:hypothetical protein
MNKRISPISVTRCCRLWSPHWCTTGIARIATEEERAELWPQIISVFEGYARYQKRTERPIPVVILEPPG